MNEPTHDDNHRDSIHCWVFMGLLLLLASTILVDRFKLGSWNLILSLGISVAKTCLIVIFFMKLRSSQPSVRLAAAGSLLWLGIAITLTMSDYVSRGWKEPSPHLLRSANQPTAYDHVIPRRNDGHSSSRSH